MSMTTAPVIDLLDPEAFDGGQPHEVFRWLREHDPVHRHDEPGGPGFWAVTRYEDVKAIGRDPATFSSAHGILIPDGTEVGDGGAGSPRMMITMDPPDHGRYRRLVVPAFIPKAVKSMQPRIDVLAGTIIDGVVEGGECDLVEQVAGLMPSYVVADLLGIPHTDGVELYRLTEVIHSAPESQPAGAAAGAAMQMLQYAHGVWEDKRAHPADDLATTLAHAEVDGSHLSEIDFGLFFLLLVDAGGDTTRNLVATGTLTLLEHPDQLTWLQADLDGRLAPAIEELLRWVSPVVYMRRTALRDSSLHGRDIRAGDKVVMYYGSANRDDAVFDEPDRLDLSRSPNEHVAFGGGGPHFCVGAHIGRAEIEAMFRQICTRLDDLQLAGDPEWLPSTFISGVKHLPVRFRVGPRQSR